jgi:hypothetical protein
MKHIGSEEDALGEGAVCLSGFDSLSHSQKGKEQGDYLFQFAKN